MMEIVPSKPLRYAVSRKSPDGVCHICGERGALSFEHIPPKAAFNNRPVVVLPFDKGIRGSIGERENIVR